MFSLLENNSIMVPLAPQVQTPAQNCEFVQQHVFGMLKTAYPHLQDAQLRIIIKGFFDLDQNLPAFKEHLRDFLVERIFTSVDQNEQPIRSDQENKNLDDDEEYQQGN
jgi:exportin-1